MKYKVLLLEKRFYKWDIHAGSAKEAEYLARQFFTLTSEREEHFLGDKIITWARLEKGKSQNENFL